MRGIERLFAGHIPRLAVEHQIGAVNLKGYWRNLALESIGWMLRAEFVCLGPSGAVWLRRTPRFYRVCPPQWSAAQASRRAPDRPDASLCCAILFCSSQAWTSAQQRELWAHPKWSVHVSAEIDPLWVTPKGQGGRAATGWSCWPCLDVLAVQFPVRDRQAWVGPFGSSSVSLLISDFPTAVIAVMSREAAPTPADCATTP